VTTDGTALELEAANPGLRSENLQVTVDHVASDPGTGSLFTLLVEELDPNGDVVATEIFRNISTVIGHARYAETVINHGSSLVIVTTSAGDGDQPTDGTYTAAGTPGDGSAMTDTEILGDRDARGDLRAQGRGPV